jgi:hypothetical protein
MAYDFGAQGEENATLGQRGAGKNMQMMRQGLVLLSQTRDTMPAIVRIWDMAPGAISNNATRSSSIRAAGKDAKLFRNCRERQAPSYFCGTGVKV